jgi:hypothetical protein
VRWLALAALLAVPAAAAPRTLTIAYQGDVGGEVAPCG